MAAAGFKAKSSGKASGKKNDPIELMTFKNSPQKNFKPLNRKALLGGDPLSKKYNLEIEDSVLRENSERTVIYSKKTASAKKLVIKDDEETEIPNEIP